MAESTLSHLNYGHAGAAVYDLDTKDWSFSRQFTAPKLKQVGINDQTSTETIPAAIKFPNTAVTTRRTDAYNNVQALGRIHPHLVPAADLLPELAVISAAIVSTTSAYDPLVGDLYSTGSITSRTRSARWDNPQRVAATVTGEAANVLCISFLCKEYMGWSSDKSVRLRSHTLRNAESGYWNEEAAPIRQVCFAQSEERSALLAVRLPTKTVIFRPFYSQHTQRTPQSNYYNLPPSFLNAHPILRLEADQTGGSAHADVTFNPDFQLQFAVVNQNQVWSVWDIEHGRKGDKYKLSCSVQGSVSSAEEAELIGDDGWARILWVGDVNTIMVCNRRQLSIVGITAGSFAYLPCPRLFTQRSDDWILDVKIHPLLRNHFFILTSACLFLMGVTTSTQALDATAGAEGAKVILSWQHYRGSEDFTLSFSVEVLDQESRHVPTFNSRTLLILW
jgi:RNA polymerase I-specific transcription initiation factor RRN6